MPLIKLNIRLVLRRLKKISSIKLSAIAASLEKEVEIVVGLCAAVFLKSVLGQGLLDALLGKTRTCRGALAGFKLGIALANHIQRALALHDLAVCVAALHRG